MTEKEAYTLLHDEICGKCTYEKCTPACSFNKAFKTLKKAKVPKTGKWVGSNGVEYTYVNSFTICSSCKKNLKGAWDFPPYCPHCGAKMSSPKKQIDLDGEPADEFVPDIDVDDMEQLYGLGEGFEHLML